MRLGVFFGFILFCLLIACSSPQKSFEKGNYKKAYNTALKSLRKGKKNRKDKSILNKSFNELVKQKTIEAERFLSSNELEDWEEAYKEYYELIDLYYDGKGYLDNDYDARMSAIESEVEELGNNIALNFYELGTMSMDGYYEDYNKAYAQDAFLYFEKTASYNVDYPSIDSLLEDAYKLAVVNVLVDANAPFERSYDWEIDRRFSDIERESKDFYLITYERNLLNVDCTLEIDFSTLESFVREERSTQQFSEEIEDGYETKVDSSGNRTRIPLFRTVTGEVATVRETLTFRWRAAVNAYGHRDYCKFRNRTFDAEEETSRERYELSGDRRAIPDRYDRNREDFVDEDDLVGELIDELYREISNYYF